MLSMATRQDFYAAEGTAIEVPRMPRGQHHSRHDRSLPCSVLQVDHKGNDTAFVILTEEK